MEKLILTDSVILMDGEHIKLTAEYSLYSGTDCDGEVSIPYKRIELHAVKFYGDTGHFTDITDNLTDGQRDDIVSEIQLYCEL